MRLYIYNVHPQPMDLGAWFQSATLIATLVPTASARYAFWILLVPNAALMALQAIRPSRVQLFRDAVAIASVSSSVAFAFEYYACEGTCIVESWNGVHGFWVGVSLAVLHTGLEIGSSVFVLGIQALLLLMLSAATASDDVVTAYTLATQMASWAIYAMFESYRRSVVRASTAMCAVIAAIALLNSSEPVRGVVVSLLLLLIAASNQCVP